MNKRVRALVEWVGREQASATERSRRKEAVDAALKEAQSPPHHAAGETSADAKENGENVPMNVDETPSSQSPDREKRPAMAGATSSYLDESGSATMKMMEELMEELISFQERFGPGAKMKERERRVISS